MDHSWGYGSEQRLREENQDCYGVFEFKDFTLIVVCDGMGGHVGGAQASSLAVRTIHDTLQELQRRPIAEALEEAIQRTNLVIYEAARKNHRLMGMGTTVVAAAIGRDTCHLAHVGDSRAYMVRDGQVQQLTRDHTMVNLFVDAELLTPEDAATHPEAHVLSRSLGVERQVDVEVSDAVPLEADDVVFLCSDGIHGVVADWELANVNWGAPHEGVHHILEIVGAREGDDNATAVALTMVTSFEDVPPTGVPEPTRFDGELGTGQPSHGSVTAVPIEDDILYDDDSGPQQPVGAGYVVYGDAPANPPAVASPPALPQAAPNPQSVNSEQPPPSRPVRAPSRSLITRRRVMALVPIAIAATALFTAAGGALFLIVPGSDDPEVLAADERVAEIHMSDPTAPPFDEPPVDDAINAAPQDPVPQAAVEPPVEDEPPTAVELAEEPLFLPDLPPPPRRLPHRPQIYTQPSPGGPMQYEAVDAARRKDCPRALVAVQEGMKASIDHATLYKGAWFCFNDTHQRKLEQATAQSWEDMKFLIPHFEGTPEALKVQAELPEHKNLPAWFRPAVGGIEFRLQTWTYDEEMVQVLDDLFGAPTVADHIAKDVHLEALAARGLAREYAARTSDGMALDPVLEQTWARRVYFATLAIEERPGRILDAHRHELVPALREMLVEAISERVVDGETILPPQAVLDARAVAMGAKPAPTSRRSTRPRPVDVQTLEPELDDLNNTIQIDYGGR